MEHNGFVIYKFWLALFNLSNIRQLNQSFDSLVRAWNAQHLWNPTTLTAWLFPGECLFWTLIHRTFSKTVWIWCYCKQSISHRQWLYASEKVCFLHISEGNGRCSNASQNGFSSAHEEPRLQACLWIQSYLNGHERLIVPLCNLSCRVPWARLEHCLYFIIIIFQRPSWPRHITPIKIAKMEFHKPPLALTYH